MPSLRVLYTLCFLVCGVVSGTQRMFRFEGTKMKGIISYQHQMSSKSPTDCVRKCRRFSHCESVAFNRTAGLCYLNPSTSDVGNGLGVLRVYTDTNLTCAASDMPTVPHAQTSGLQTKLTSAKANVTCDAGFLFNVSDVLPTLSCLDKGNWELNGECLQRIWNSSFVPWLHYQSFRFPRPLSVGGSLCLSGIPKLKKSKWLVADFTDAAGNILMHLGIHMDILVTVFDSYRNGAFQHAVRLEPPSHPFPFAINTLFSMNITATALNKLQVKVDGTVLYTWTTFSAVDTIVNVYLDFGENKLQLHELDLFCN